MAFWKAVKSWLKNYGFVLLVFLAAVTAAAIALGTTTPGEIPDPALKSEALYRLEVGGASFAILYLGIMALFLALHGRGFTQIGPDGVQAEWVVSTKQQKVIKGQEESLSVLRRNVEKGTKATRNLNAEIRTLKERIAKLEESK